MAIDYRQSGIDYRDEDYSYQGVQTHAIAAALTSTSSITSAVFKQAFVVASVSSTSTITSAVLEQAFIAVSMSSTSTVTAAILEEAFIVVAPASVSSVTAALFKQAFAEIAPYDIGPSDSTFGGPPYGSPIASTSTITSAIVVGQFPAYPSLPISSTSSLTAVAYKWAFIVATTSSTSAITIAIQRRVPQPELTLSVSNILGSSKAEEQQDTLSLLVGV